MERKYRPLRIVSLIIALMLLCAMWFFSAQDGQESGELSGAVVDFIIRLFKLDATGALISRLGYVVRKAAHFNLFAALGLSLGLAIGEARHPGRALIALPIAALCALADETHQHFVAARAAMWQDCLLDTCGALTGALLALLILCLLRRRLKKLA